MNKTEFVAKVAETSGQTKVVTEKIVNAVLATIGEELKSGGSVQFTGFGTFLVRDRAARAGRNPKTGAAMQIPAQKTPAFKPGKSLKDTVK